MPENQINLPFPLKGIDVTREFQLQPPGTTVDALNVFSKDSIAHRNRGGSRPGISKSPVGQLNRGTTVFQHLNVIVDPSTDALPQNFNTPDGTWIPNPRTGLDMPPGGTGDQQNPNASQPATAITRIQAKRTKFSPPGGTETISFASAITNNNTGVVGVVTLANSSGVGVTVTNGGVTAYTQVGSYIEILDPRTVDSYVRLSAWKKTLNSGADDDSIKVSAAGIVTMTVVQAEYRGMPTSSQVDTAVTNSDNTLTPAAPATTGNVAVLGTKEMLLGFFATILDASGFTAGAGFSLVPNEDDGTDFDLRLNVVEKIGLNFPGDNPTAATGTTTGGEDPYVALGATFKKS